MEEPRVSPPSAEVVEVVVGVVEVVLAVKGLSGPSEGQKS